MFLFYTLKGNVLQVSRKSSLTYKYNLALTSHVLSSSSSTSPSNSPHSLLLCVCLSDPSSDDALTHIDLCELLRTCYGKSKCILPVCNSSLCSVSVLCNTMPHYPRQSAVYNRQCSPDSWRLTAHSTLSYSIMSFNNHIQKVYFCFWCGLFCLKGESNL